jgi:hypothetical protein
LKFRIVAGMCLLLLGLAAPAAQASQAAADPTSGPPICSSAGTAIAGNFQNLTITGNAYVESGTALTVRDNVVLKPGSCLDAFSLGRVLVGGNISVGKGAILALGCTPASIGPGPPCDGQSTTDAVGGNIVANHPYTMYLDGDSIGGNVVSIGGGPGPTLNPYVNFPIKDNSIFGNLVVEGWQGAWFGALRDAVRGNVVIANNVGVTIGETGQPDSTEIASNTIRGNLICFGNSPKAQLGDSGGTLNLVGGKKMGECRAV